MPLPTETPKIRLPAELIETTSDKNMVVPVLERLMGDINKRKFREVLVRDCAITFYDPIFLKSLNTKTHLVACKNGVYDLTAAEFRSGKPSDYLTFSTHRNFVAERPRCGAGVFVTVVLWRSTILQSN